MTKHPKVECIAPKRFNKQMVKDFIMKKFAIVFRLFLLVLLPGSFVHAQVSPLHVESAGQIHTPGGLVLLGNRSELHMEMDFNRIQSLFSAQANPISLLLQPDGGNVGIGTSNPQTHVHVVGSSDQFLTLHKSTSGLGSVGINLLRGATNSMTDWRVVNADGNFKILRNIDNFQTDGTECLTISTVGNASFGPAPPVSRLNVNGPNNITLAAYGDLTIGDAAGANVSYDDNDIFARNGANPSTLRMQYFGGNVSLCQNSDGKVGIGTSIPEVKLQIVGGNDVNLAGGGQLILGNTGSQNLALDDNEIMARNNGGVAPLYIQGNGGDVMIIPNEGGQVGIGVISTNSLPVGYMLAVDGKIISEEVRVELSGDWPDYVFENDYKLLPLEVLENQIKEIGHLPGIPSAAEVEVHGFELGDMQKRMMEKIEELTLYIIEANKKIERLEQRIID
jgi:hypothetical protein